jgi:hypothetical protein
MHKVYICAAEKKLLTIIDTEQDLYKTPPLPTHTRRKKS